VRVTHLLAAAAAAVVSLSALSAQAATNLLVNGSFEDGLSGWALTGNTSYTTLSCAPGQAQAGACYVNAGPVGSDGYLTQSFDTHAGDALTISGWIHGSASGFSHVLFQFNGVTLFDSGNPVPGGWVQHTVNATATGHDTLTVAFRNDPSYVRLDNFSVTAASPPGGVPEPAAWALMLTGFGAGGAMLRRRRAAIA
jgi:hypothetical protein